MEAISLEPVWLSLELAVVTTGVLLARSTPLAWWLARAKSVWRAPVGSVVTSPLVAPPAVMGFYILVALGPHGPLGQFTQSMGWGLLTFTIQRLVIRSLDYSFPFAVQPLQGAFEALGDRPMEVAATLGAKPIDAFFSVVLPLVRPGVFTATVLTFAHTIGEFGVVLMIGGNIPGKTQVVSTEIYTFVEAMEYDKAHILAFCMLVFSFFVLLALSFHIGLAIAVSF